MVRIIKNQEVTDMRSKKFLIVLISLLIIGFYDNSAYASIRLGVMKFVSKADGVSSYQAEAAGDVFVRVLANNTDNISILERERLDEIGAEQRLSMSGLVDTSKAVQIGRVAGCQYMLMGSVTNLKSKQSNINLPFAIGIGVREATATATIDVRIVDVETTEIVGAFHETGTGKQSGTSLEVMGVTFDSDELSGMEAEAIAKATEKLCPKIVKLLTRTSGTNGDAGEITFRRSRTSQTHAERRMEEAQQTRTTRANRAVNRVNNPEEITFRRSRTAQEHAERRREEVSDNSNYDDYDNNSGYEQQQNQETLEFENYSTNPEDVIPTYGLDEKRTENLINAHNRFWRTSNKRAAYQRFTSLFNDNANDYLAAYRAGILAQQLGMRDDAKAWFETALDINPNYEPAQKAKSGVSNSRSSSNKRRRK